MEEKYKRALFLSIGLCRLGLGNLCPRGQIWLSLAPNLACQAISGKPCPPTPHLMFYVLSGWGRHWHGFKARIWNLKLVFSCSFVGATHTSPTHQCLLLQELEAVCIETNAFKRILKTSIIAAVSMPWKLVPAPGVRHTPITHQLTPPVSLSPIHMFCHSWWETCQHRELSREESPPKPTNTSAALRALNCFDKC